MKRPQIEFSERGNCSGSCGESESEETACEFMSASGPLEKSERMF